MKLDSLFLRKFSIGKKITRRIEHAYLMHDFKHPFGGHLPAELETGQRIDLSFAPDQCKFLDDNFTHIGISDSFGRLHWCKKRDMLETRKAFSNGPGRILPQL
ncbi:MAG TPA: hypothetical protein VFQ43_22160 [Nitrososphaera sp.]|nr:hypothetical protein [Nitrososphaera sp.]